MEGNKTIEKIRIWPVDIISGVNHLPAALIYMLIFAAAAFIGSAAAYYINPTGLLCGVLAVLIFKGK